MRIVHIIPGSGGKFYCGNCLRDSKYTNAIRAQGADAVKIPMYLPLFSRNNDEPQSDVPVFYGAVNIYLKQLFPIFRHTPKWLEKILDSNSVLNFAAGKANSTRAYGLEEMTVSMLLGEQGKQREELERMAEWLEDHYKTDLIHISNALLLGLTHRLKECLNVPVVCSLQDEDTWVDGMSDSFKEKIWDLLREKARDIDMFISVSHYYTSFMTHKLNIPPHKIKTLHLGVDPADYRYINSSEKGRNIGFLSRLSRDNGLDILVDAFIILKSFPGNESAKLFLTGGYTSDDIQFVKEQKNKISRAELEGFVFFIEEFYPAKRNEFFEQITLLSVPVRHGEAFGIYLTEAMAAGIPVVQPPLGAFPEIIEKSGGGIIYFQNTPDALATALNQLLEDTQMLGKLSSRARKSIEESFNINHLAAEMTEIYKEVIESYKDATNTLKLH